MINFMEFDDIDILSFLISGICHDFKHDGFTNGYHINARTDRAIVYNDVSVQENYHVAQTFEVLRHQEYDFISELSKDEKTVFRKRMIECILSTDMSRHSNLIS